MELVTKVDRPTHIKYWLKIWNGGMGLTDKEQAFLAEILLVIMDLRDKNITEPYLGQLVFGTSGMKIIRDKLKLSKQGLHNYKKKLIEKGVMVKDERGAFTIREQMIPQESITFKFEYND